MKHKSRIWSSLNRHLVWLKVRTHGWLHVWALCAALLVLLSVLSFGYQSTGADLVRNEQRAWDDAERAKTLDARAAAFATLYPQVAADAFRRAATSFAHGGNATDHIHSGAAYGAARNLLRSITDGKASVPCEADPTLPVDAWHGGSVLFAADLHNNEHVMPHFISQLIQAITQLPFGRVFVSIYESGSSDNTLLWLQLLQTLLGILGTPNNIVMSGAETRQPDEDRIQFLAKECRNLALKPLWARNATTRFDADRVVFLNDVFYCAKDIKRLLLHDAHIACGMDFNLQDLRDIAGSRVGELLVEHLNSRYSLPRWLGKAVAKVRPARRSFAHHQPNVDAFRASAPLGFYDIWVAHDAGGHRFQGGPPYVTHLYSQQRLRDGLPIPVNCCWNGLVVFDAAPFKRGLRFRMHEPEECAASECSLMCDDFRRLGYTRAVLDPGVRTAYELQFAEQVNNPERVLGIKPTWWSDVQSAPPVDMTTMSETQHQWCCFLEDGEDAVHFDRSCKVYAPFEFNYTDSFFKSAQYQEAVALS